MYEPSYNIIIITFGTKLILMGDRERYIKRKRELYIYRQEEVGSCEGGI